jgi:two-component system sensor histidine kinase KdpD
LAGAVAVATVLVYALKPIAPTLSLGVLYTLAVLATAVLFGVGYAAAAAVASMVTFNFLFLPPVHTLTLADGRNWAALGVYLTTAVVASELAARARRRAAEAEQREREAALLADAAAALLQEASLGELEARAERVLAGSDRVARTRFESAIESLRALAQERREAESLRRSDAIKTTILQTVSHDFRTPIATISAAVGGLEDGALHLTASDRVELLETIRLETARLSRLVENVLDLSRLQAGVAAPHSGLWHVDDLLGQALVEVSDPARVHVAAPPDLPAVLVDPVHIQRVLVNLVENALKFSTGTVELTADVNADTVFLRVLDRGPGFEAVPTGRGLGLGLEIARGFAAVNNGEIRLASREGGGTDATLALSAAPVPAELAR